MTIVAAGVPTASAVVPPLPMTSLGHLHLQPERVKILACLPSLWIRAKIALLLVSPLSLLPCSILVRFYVSKTVRRVLLSRCWAL